MARVTKRTTVHAVEIKVKRVYEPAEVGDGARFLVERLWPRGLREESLHADGWLREVAPSSDLRRWFGHDPARWAEFRRRYNAELEANAAAVRPLLEALRERGTVTLLFSAHDTEHNAALVLREFLEASVRAGQA